METESALQGAVRGNDDHTNPKVEAANGVNKTFELLKRDLNHTQAHLNAITSDVKAMHRADVEHFISLQSALRSEGLAWITILIALVGVGVTVIGGIAVRNRVKRLRKEHRKLIDIARADISTYVFCVLGGAVLICMHTLTPSAM